MSDKVKVQALPQGRATDEWLLRHVADVLEHVVKGVNGIYERLDDVERRLRSLEESQSQDSSHSD